MIETGIVAVTVKVAARFRSFKALGERDVVPMATPFEVKRIRFFSIRLLSFTYFSAFKQLYLFLGRLYGSNVCGEEGEYETLTFDCPLFKYTRIVLDEFQLVLHDSNFIAPVGILHPLAFHCEDKPNSASVSDSNRTNMGSVIEVQNESLEIVEDKCQLYNVAFKLTELEKCRLYISKTRKKNTFSISCWLAGPRKKLQ